MHDEAVVAFDIAGIGFIVVNTVPVERERGIAKQQRAVERDLFGEDFIGAGDWWRSGVCGVWDAVHQFLPFGKREGLSLPDIMAHAHKCQRSAAPIFAGHALNG